MNYLNLLFRSATRVLSNVGGIARGSSPAVASLGGLTLRVPETVDNTWNLSGDDFEDYLLPSGIASMEHWLDLNG